MRRFHDTRQMDDMVGAVDEVPQSYLVAKLAVDGHGSWNSAAAGQCAYGERLGAPDNRLAGQTLDEMTPDEAGGTGDGDRLGHRAPFDQAEAARR